MDDYTVCILEDIRDLLRFVAAGPIGEVTRQIAENDEYSAALDVLREKGEVSAGELKEAMTERLGISPRTAQSRIQELVSMGVLVIRKEGTYNMYSVSNLIG